jgi:hypothetical protein
MTPTMMTTLHNMKPPAMAQPTAAVLKFTAV